MEIPYIFTPRKDTGMVNSKIAIWLFLASEVMLFGGFFSSYVYLRLGADYPWPERALPVLPGLINTFVLIASSVTVVFAWAALKLRNWRGFQISMAFTIICALIFMVLKGIEYNVKWHHQAIRLTDYTILEGHLDFDKKADTGKVDKSNQPIYAEADQIHVIAEKLTFTSVRFHEPWVKEILRQANAAKATITLAEDLTINGSTIKAGESLSVDLLNAIRDNHLASRAHNGRIRTDALRSAWKAAWDKTENQGKKGWQISNNVKIDDAAIAASIKLETPSVTFNVSPSTDLWFYHRDIKEAPDSSKLRDDTAIVGKLQSSPVKLHNLDAIDFRHVVMQAEKKGIDPIIAIENTWIINNCKEVREAWEWNKSQNKKLAARLIEKEGLDENGKPKLEPTLTEKYRIGWKDFVAKANHVDRAYVGDLIKTKEEFMGPDYEGRKDQHTFPHLSVPREMVFLSGKFTPAWNTYYAIYFTMTALHGLHVVGGATVLGYYLFFGKKMYRSNPEWLANRVEVGGLFWHFVDLVWIFLFPILYLM
jgi:heme/copper-type cytochrome/quinol oxidase subunit 3